jgi:hypothetical protein
MEFQSHEPANAVFLNGHFLGYLPVKDWTYSWVSARFSVPCHFLWPRYNELTVRTNYLPPQFQGPGFTRDEVLFRGVYLEHATSDAPSVGRPESGEAKW